MTHKTLRNFFVAAPMIYAAVSRLAAMNAHPSRSCAEGHAALFRKRDPRRRRGERALLNQRFHAIIGEMADNEYLMPSLRRLLIDHTRISMTFYDPRNPRWPDNATPPPISMTSSSR
jgi:DNA-binding GntR family transcriptional regulator